ncbi:MAG: BatD family protein [Ferruginibacter sp.]
MFIILCKHSIAQPKFSAKIYPSEITTNELATLQFVIENYSDSKYFTLPELNGLEIVSGPNYNSESFSINGKSKHYSTISFVIRARRPGVYKLMDASCEVDRKILKCNPLTLTVKNSGRNPKIKYDDNYHHNKADVLEDQYIRTGESVESKIKEGMHLRLSVSKNSCYVGEPVVATYKLYSRLNSDCRLVQNPSFNGFSVIDLQAPDVTEKYFEEYKGQKYAVYVIRKSQLYPLIDGKIELEPASVEGAVDLIKIANSNENNVSNIFEDAFFRETIRGNISLKTDSSFIYVKALPPGKPEGFAGAVGKFNIQSKLVENVFNANKGGKLILSIEGKGNFQMINPPLINWPKGFEVFEPVTIENLNKSAVPISGKKDFECEFNTNFAGDYKIPPINFSYFDPELKVYKTVSTEEISFRVLPSVGKSNSQLYAINSPATQNVEPSFYKNKIVLAAGGTILIGLIFFIVFKNNKKTNVPEYAADLNDERWSKVIESRNHHPLIESENCIKLEDCSKFYFILNTEFKKFLSSKFGVEPNKISTGFVKDCMDKNNICNSTMLSVEQLLNEIEWRSYTPFVRDDQMELILIKTQEMVQLINSYDCGKV